MRRDRGVHVLFISNFKSKKVNVLQLSGIVLVVDSMTVLVVARYP